MISDSQLRALCVGEANWKLQLNSIPAEIEISFANL